MNVNNAPLSRVVVIDSYSNETFLPCRLKEVISHIGRKIITAKAEEKVGLNTDINVIPLNREGYILYTKNLVLFTNNLKLLFQVNGAHSLHDLCATSEMKSCLEQLHYYNLLSFGSNKGQIRVARIDPKYKKIYQDGDFITFSLIPITVELDITNSCNFACIHCFRDSKPVNPKEITNKELSTKELLAIIEDCTRIGVPELLLMGGEPLIHPDFLKLAKYAKERGIRDVRTSTNGWFINETMAKELAKYFDNMQISIHGASALTHDSIVGKKGAFEQAKKAIKFLKKYSLKVNVSFTVMRENIDDVKKCLL